MADRLRQIPGVRTATPFVLQQALFTLRGAGATGGLLRGVDLGSPSARAEMVAHLRGGTLDRLLRPDGEPGIVLGRELARSLGAAPGDSITVISPQGAMTAVGLVPKMRRFHVAALIELGLWEHDSSVAYAALPAAQEFAGLGDRVSGIEVKLTDPFEARVVGRQIAAALGPAYWLRDWMDMNRNLFAALQLEKLALFVIVTIIVLVAAFAIIGHLILLVAEKRREIGILKAMGASAGSIASVFLVAGMVIGAAGHGSRKCLRAPPDLGPEHVPGDPARRRRLPDRPLAHEAHRLRLHPDRGRYPRDLLPGHAVAGPPRGRARPRRRAAV